MRCDPSPFKLRFLVLYICVGIFAHMHAFGTQKTAIDVIAREVATAANRHLTIKVVGLI